MRITNKKNVILVRFTIITFCIVLVTAAVLISKPTFNALAICIILVLLSYALIITHRVFEYSGECVTFKKYFLLNTSYVRPYFEIPAHYIKDYKVSRVLYIYYVTIIIDNGTSIPKAINLSLQWFGEHHIIGIVKTLESNKRKNLIM